jgi:hypothetical protein
MPPGSGAVLLPRYGPMQEMPADNRLSLIIRRRQVKGEVKLPSARMVNTAAGVSRLTTSFIVPAPPAVPRSARDQPGPPVPITGPAKFGCFLGQWPIAGKSPRPGQGAITQGDASMLATAVAGGRLVLDPHGRVFPLSP